MKTIIKEGRKIKGFVFQDKQGEFWFAFGKPSQDNYISFRCESIEEGINNIKKY
jgi:hypothetical protein